MDDTTRMTVIITLVEYLKKQNKPAAREIVTALTSIHDENIQLRKEIEYLRHYGNKDCTAMADEAMEEGRMDD